MAFDEVYHLPYIVRVDQDAALGCAFPTNVRNNVYILAITEDDPRYAAEVLADFAYNRI
jgi:hypothetical protein